ncbi:MAG: 5-dehydro-2-deoxygluconokinase [Hoeflea sp.]|uniref:5-dehydro-2-deoxygluconokinase n=1 Tax=Hoeflea sp. TaxID=1940281 RepID=UPI001D52C416|nr:5-dehydro-2-deoxygluconokinase [Hoeflea sp.]MBU4530497.1 5-dehydro-2-deoxygluconokinase [Alphaproteobacteria bacterium]MBU4545284.1 5-dehydro-2-deoxygluconokinase [Alphaproteobacteria bacterium]MBU4548933.1 5-dehydro-2-deoxygluconokinase [Alphaproteobacteria bacterium]MBV1722088.1 5-dehydro-2-deoxygluconokinase [Hoeflea sp.]MBV1761438.1 5-dehydro-2-deoxygluconokinase [Hoeflea sp.]
MKVLDGIKARNFLVIGRVGMDLCPDPPGVRTRDASSMMVSMGGSSANIAAGLVKLGCKAALVTKVSNDAVGWYCLNQLDHYGVDRTHVKAITGECRTSLAVYESRVEEHQSVIYRNNAADFQMGVSDVEAVDYAAFGALITAGTVFAAEPSRSAAFRAFELARAAGLPVIFDIDYRPYSWPSADVAADVLSRAGAMADLIVGNDEEFGFMAGGLDKGLAKARTLAATSAVIVVYKMGPKGAVAFADGRELRTGIYPVTALKPTGAGDSFMAGLLASLSEGQGLEDAVLRGSACAAIAVSRPGCAPAMPTTAELEDFLSTHSGPMPV